VPRVTIDTSQTLGSFLPPSHRRDRKPVGIERLPPKRHRFFDNYDYDNDNDNDNDKDKDKDNGKDCVRCSTCFFNRP